MFRPLEPRAGKGADLKSQVNVLIAGETNLIGDALRLALGSTLHLPNHKIRCLPNDIYSWPEVFQLIRKERHDNIVIIISDSASAQKAKEYLDCLLFAIYESAAMNVGFRRPLVLSFGHLDYLRSAGKIWSYETFCRFRQLPILLQDICATLRVPNRRARAFDVYLKEITVERAKVVSERYLRDFKHTIVDKQLPRVIDNSGLLRLIAAKTILLFSDDASRLFGIDMKNVFRNQLCEIRMDLKSLFLGIEGKPLSAITEALSGGPASVIARTIEHQSRRTELNIDYEKERQASDGLVAQLSTIFQEVWKSDMWDLSADRYEPIWRSLKSKGVEYYQLRSLIEMKEAILSIWLTKDNNGFRRLSCDFLDPLMQRIEEEDFGGASRIFDSTTLAMLRIPKGVSFSSLIRGHRND